MFESVATADQCLTAVAYTAGSEVTLQSCNAGDLWQRQVVAPETATGAGAAGEDTRQLVNFDQFGAAWT